MRETVWNNGVLEVHDYDELGTVTVTHQEDVTQLLDRCKTAANNGSTDHGIKNGFWHYASIPTTVVYEMLKKGIDIHNPDHLKRAEVEIESNYPFLKTTSKRLILPRSSSSRNARASLKAES